MLLFSLRAGWVLHGQCFLACTSGHQNWGAVCPHPCIQVTKAESIAASSGQEGGHCNLLLARHLQVTVLETFPPQPLSQRPCPRWWYGLAQCWLYSPAKAASSCAQSTLCLLTFKSPSQASCMHQVHISSIDCSTRHLQTQMCRGSGMHQMSDISSPRRQSYHPNSGKRFVESHPLDVASPGLFTVW